MQHKPQINDLLQHENAAEISNASYFIFLCKVTIGGNSISNVVEGYFVEFLALSTCYVYRSTLRRWEMMYSRFLVAACEGICPVCGDLNDTAHRKQPFTSALSCSATDYVLKNAVIEKL